MIRSFRFSPSRVALGYIALSVVALALFAIPLWYGWRVNIATFRSYVESEDMQRLVDDFNRQGRPGTRGSAVGAANRDLFAGHASCARQPSLDRFNDFLEVKKS